VHENVGRTIWRNTVMGLSFMNLEKGCMRMWAVQFGVNTVVAHLL
jgi:hypothetical protein